MFIELAWLGVQDSETRVESSVYHTMTECEVRLHVNFWRCSTGLKSGGAEYGNFIPTSAHHAGAYLFDSQW